MTKGCAIKRMVMAIFFVCSASLLLDGKETRSARPCMGYRASLIRCCSCNFCGAKNDSSVIVGCARWVIAMLFECTQGHDVGKIYRLKLKISSVYVGWVFYER